MAGGIEIDEDDRPSPVADVLEELTSFLDEAAEEGPEGWVLVERMRVTMPIEFYVRPDEQEGRVARLETRMPQGMLTSVPPVLHGLSLMVEVDRAEREPGVEP